MLIRLLSCLGFVALLTTSALAQTGRLAHLSHGGSPAALATAERADNFGIPSQEYQYDKITRLDDSVMQVEGRQRDYGSREPWQPYKWQQQYQWGSQRQRGTQLLHQLRQQYPNAQLVGFDSTTASPPRRRKSAFDLVLPINPGATPGGALVLLVLAGAGWLLAGQPRPVPAVVAA